MIGSHDGYRLALVTHSVGGQNRLVGEGQTVGVLPGNVFCGEHGRHAGDRERFGDIDGQQAGVRMRRAQGPAPEHGVGVQVRGEGERPGDLGNAVGARRRLADP